MRNLLTRFAVAALGIVAALAVPAESAETKPTYRLTSGRKPGQTDRVVVLLEVGGDVIRNVEGKDDRSKMSVVCHLTYDEKTLLVADHADGDARSVRHYEKATAALKVGPQTLEPALRPQRRLIGVKIDSQRATLFSPHGPISRDELELIDVLGNSLLLDRFLPQRPVAVGESWEHSQKLMAALLGLDAVARTDVHSKLTEVSDAAARIELVGRVEGALYGVSTVVEMKAKYRFDRRSKRIDWFAMLVKEQRNNSHVIEGVDVVARVQLQIAPNADSPQLSTAALEGLKLEPDAAAEQLTYRSDDGDWQLTHDRRWHVMYGDREDRVVLRLVDRGELISQCNVSPLPKAAPGKGIALAEFQNDVQRALGDAFGEFVEAGQRANEANYREYRVVVRGTVRRAVDKKVLELPIQWNYYLVADEHGRQVAFTFSVETGLAEQLDRADRELLSAFRFIDPKLASNGKE